MIYIIEGITGAGKTTFANSLKGYEIRKTKLSTFEEIKNTLSEIEGNVVFDRLFGIRWIYRPEKEILELNEYLKTVPNLICLKFMVDKNISLEEYSKKIEVNFKREIHKQEKVIFKKVVDRQHEGFTKLFKLMDVFKERKEQPK